MFEICPEAPEDAPAIDLLLDKSFGPGRFAKTAYRLREDVNAIDALSLVARAEGRLVGSIRFWPIVIGPSHARALLLGPLAVEPQLKGQGIGIGLMNEGLKAAKALGYEVVILVGDEPYYARVGFARVPAGQLKMPGPVDPANEVENGHYAQPVLDVGIPERLEAGYVPAVARGGRLALHGRSRTPRLSEGACSRSTIP